MAVKYIGSKRTLVPLLVRTVKSLGKECTFLDLYSGTSRLGCALNAAGYRRPRESMGSCKRQ